MLQSHNAEFYISMIDNHIRNTYKPIQSNNGNILAINNNQLILISTRYTQISILNRKYMNSL